MNRALTEMLQHLNMPQNIVGDIADMEMTQMSVLERQQVRMKWQQEPLQQQQQPMSYMNDSHQISMFHLPAQTQEFQGFMSSDQGLRNFESQAMKQDPTVENGWNTFCNTTGVDSCAGDTAKGSGFDVNYSIPRTISCPPAVAAAIAEAAVATDKRKESATPEKLSSAVGRESFKKRKPDKMQSQKKAEEETKDKKMKGCAQDGDSKITEQHSNNKSTSNNSNKEPSAGVSKENSKVSEVQKLDYIHVRARRGQATDSHSLAERVRREKISERMKYLQDLVPGCNKIIGKAGMLDEIINYVQSLQRQVEFLSMKLATVNPTIDFNIDSLFTKEIIPAGISDFPTMGLPQDMANPANLQFNPLQVVSSSGLEAGVSQSETALRRTISAPVSIPETLLDPSCFNQIQHPPAWDADFQNLYAMEFQPGKAVSPFSQPFAGYIGAGHVKLEM